MPKPHFKIKEEIATINLVEHDFTSNTVQPTPVLNSIPIQLPIHPVLPADFHPNPETLKVWTESSGKIIANENNSPSASETNTNISEEEKQYVMEEELLSNIMATFGVHYVLWDSPYEDISHSSQQEYQAKMEVVQQKIWNESHEDRRNRVKMAVAKVTRDGHHISAMRRKIRSRVASRLKRMSESEEKRKKRLEKDRLRSILRRARETPEEKANRRECNRLSRRQSRMMESPEARELRLSRTRDAVRKRRAMQRQLYGDEIKKIQTEKARERRRRKRETETPEEREQRLCLMRTRAQERRKLIKELKNFSPGPQIEIEETPEQKAQKQARRDRYKERRRARALQKRAEQLKIKNPVKKDGTSLPNQQQPSPGNSATSGARISVQTNATQLQNYPQTFFITSPDGTVHTNPHTIVVSEPHHQPQTFNLSEFGLVPLPPNYTQPAANHP